MKEKDLEAKKISELRVLAKELGIVQKRDWKKEDFIKAIQKASSLKDKKRGAARKAAAKARTEKAAPKNKKAEIKAGGKKEKSRKAAPREKAPAAPEEVGITKKATRRDRLIDKLSGMPHELPNGSRDFLKVSSRVTLMVIDPYKLFVYWDIDAGEVEKIISDGEGFMTVLRIFFFKGDEQTGFFDIRIPELSGKKYIEVVPDRGYQVEFAVIKGDKYFPIIKSKIKTTPAFKIEKEDLQQEKIDLFAIQIPSPRVRISS